MRKRKMEQPDIIAKILFPVAVFAGGAIMLLSLVGTGIIVTVPIIAGVCTIVIIQTLYDHDKALFRKTATAVILAYICSTFIFMRKGLAITLNALINSWKHIYPKSYSVFSVTSNNEALCQILLLVLVSVSVAAFVTMSVRNGKQIPFYISTVILISTALVFQQILAWQYILAAAVSIALWLFSIIGRREGHEYEEMLAGDLAIIIRVIPIVIVVAIIWGETISDGQYEKPVFLKNAEDTARHTVSLLRYGGERDTGMPQGRLYKADELKLSEDEILRVTMQEPDSYYLRGFVGGTYEDNRWTEVSSQKLSQYTDMFYWLHQNGFYGYTQLSKAAEQEYRKVNSYELNIENTGGNSKYLYAPYETSSETEGLDPKATGDSAIKAKGLFGDREYSLMVKKNQVTRFPQIASALSRSDGQSEYIRDESYYNDFVYSNYMDVPEDIRTLLIEYLGEYDIAAGQIHFDYQMAKQNITYFMTNKVEYDEKVGKIGRDKDFIVGFLSDTKKGYSIHYASAAAMMFRYYGIPARYVEGYLITKDDAAKAAAGDTVILDGTHAHAWVEYYHDGVGWLPFEVTPSYLSVMPTAEKMQDVSGLVGKNGQQQALDIREDDIPDESMDEGIDEYWLQNSLIKALAVCGILLIILVIAFMVWIRRGIKKRDMMFASFESEDISEAICCMFGYTAKMLLAWGLDPVNGSLQNQKEEFVRLMGEDTASKYEEAVSLYQEAKYSDHDMSEADRINIRAFKDNVYETMWERSSTMERIKYNYMYFL